MVKTMIVASCLALASCDSTADRKAPAPPPCDAPVTLPDRALNDQEIEVYWGRDRSALRECGGRLEVAVGPR